ncbi:uncharacterized protein PHACADRAFT_260696 [Phanerochaete carnosa HHB-10118-sp]|uniref:F-box domain-containing protein n=1 Tax=Phanerochaete carnosa (strain HHB-10118-sp) TaxID=650164 RepID=K5VZX8_PHACS|nr:uncharacterized protein PHACADRAFT_260696 [Phanerochaete carnosa HHB-10118-sp]EKM52375.1 hypothetical protein PHACADRAFT_260696 [Phanerochaete carnosa HHB-10118-sp]
MPAETTASPLGRVPQEVLEHIAFFAATDGFLGPPAGLVPLLSLNRAMHDALSFQNNPHLYARVFAGKYDEDAAVRRLGAAQLPATALAEELQRRSLVLKRIRARYDSKVPSSDKHLGRVMWTAYLMVLENDGKNERQLLEYARANEWLKEYLFDARGASQFFETITASDKWIANSELMSLALWLFWYLLQPEDYLNNDAPSRDASGILKVIALGAHKYPSCYPDWVDFVPRGPNTAPTTIRHFSSEFRLVAPAPAPAAILAYLTLANKSGVSWDSISYSKPIFPPLDVDRTARTSAERDCEWARLRNLAEPKIFLRPTMSGAFTPGSLEGVWEGVFTYTEFTSYAALLSGAPPSVLQRSLVAQHSQTIKVREWHFVAPAADHDNDHDHDADADAPMLLLHGDHEQRPLGPGNPSRGYVPDGIEIHEGSDRLELVLPGHKRPVVYHAWASVRKQGLQARVQDVFLTGEGHSAWGQFNLVGRVRPSDGYISLSKEYMQTDGDRGKWLYRAYMVGNANGNLAGRWRDTLSPAHIQGYEGTWVASRRR